MRKLKDPCASCGRPLDPQWKICPFCEAEVGASPVPRRTRRRREGGSEAPVPARPPESGTARPAEQMANRPSEQTMVARPPSDLI
jgi:hypothetical protein